MILNHTKYFLAALLCAVTGRMIAVGLSIGDSIFAFAVLAAIVAAFVLEHLEAKVEKPSKSNLELQKSVEEIERQLLEHSNRLSSLSVSAGFVKPKPLR